MTIELLAPALEEHEVFRMAQPGLQGVSESPFE
jgi:hypothetical protein